MLDDRIGQQEIEPLVLGLGLLSPIEYSENEKCFSFSDTKEYYQGYLSGAVTAFTIFTDHGESDCLKMLCVLYDKLMKLGYVAPATEKQEDIGKLGPVVGAKNQ